MTTPINYPCVMLEVSDFKNCHVSRIGDKKFNLIFSASEFKEKKEKFNNPFICSYHSIINEAVELLGLKFCNRSKTYISKL